MDIFPRLLYNNNKNVFQSQAKTAYSLKTNLSHSAKQTNSPQPIVKSRTFWASLFETSERIRKNPLRRQKPSLLSNNKRIAILSVGGGIARKKLRMLKTLYTTQKIILVDSEPTNKQPKLKNFADIPKVSYWYRL